MWAAFYLGGMEELGGKGRFNMKLDFNWTSFSVFSEGEYN